MTSIRESSGDRSAVEAATWFASLREGEFTDEERGRFADWLGESPVHVREYLAVTEMWGALQAAQPWSRQSQRELIDILQTAHHANVRKLNNCHVHPPTLSSGKGGNGRRTRISLAITAGVVLFVVVAVGALFSMQSTVYETGRGEQHSVVLADGSVMQLNALTRVVIHFDDKRRRIELSQGEAFFRVAHETRRPFYVETPAALVRAVGTEFNVYSRTVGTRVAVLAGRVQVAPAAEMAASALLKKPDTDVRLKIAPARLKLVSLSAKQSLDVDREGAMREVTSTMGSAADLAIAWLQRRVVLDNTSVGAAVEEFNRYNKIQMKVRDPQLAQLRISGVFNVDEPQALMQYLREIQRVTIYREGDSYILERSAATL